MRRAKALTLVTLISVPLYLWIAPRTALAPAKAEAIPTTVTSTIVAPSTTVPNPYAGGTGARLATDDFWHRLSWCETNSNWRKGWRYPNQNLYGGGLGIFTRGRFRDDDSGTWERWGGEEFARHPSGATVAEQIIVANRISTQGYRKTYRDGSTYWKPPVGFTGWGALPCAGDPYQHGR